MLLSLSGLHTQPQWWSAMEARLLAPASGVRGTPSLLASAQASDLGRLVEAFASAGAASPAFVQAALQSVQAVLDGASNAPAGDAATPVGPAELAYLLIAVVHLGVADSTSPVAAQLADALLGHLAAPEPAWLSPELSRRTAAALAAAGLDGHALAKHLAGAAAP